MALSSENKRKLQYLWEDGHEVDWIQTFVKIADKQGKIVPFILTDEQRELVENLDRENIILKSRQLGISSVVIALSIRACIVNDNIACLLVSHNQSSTNAIFDKLKQQFYSLPEFIRPELLTNNRQELKFANGSNITCLTAGNKDVGRGSTYAGIVHLSEYAFWKNPDKQLKALTQALSDTGILIIESTANGFNKFSEVYFQAKNGENSYKDFFFNWINGGHLFENLYKQSVKKYIAVNEKMLTRDELDGEEEQLFAMGATLNQLVWRRQKISTDGKDTFNVEFPSTDNECFLTTGKQLFDSKRLDSCLKAVLSNKKPYIPLDNLIDVPSILKQYYGKSFQIYKLPEGGQKYYIGVDCSEGIGQDYSTAIVLNADGEQVAQFRNNSIKPYQYTDIIYALGFYYNKAMLTIEKASGGHSVIERLRHDSHYMNMTKYKSYDQFNRTMWQVGFDTNSKTKSIIVNDCREWFEKGLLKINSRELLEEMQKFVADNNGSMGAIRGSHDDLVMALCLAIVGLKSGLWYPF